MFKEVIELIEDVEIKKESIFPSFFKDIQLDGASEIKEVHESKNVSNNNNTKDSIFPDLLKDIILK